MNKFEFRAVIKCIGTIVGNRIPINGCEFYHNDKYFAIVHGKVPYELAKLINEKYDNNKYKIRVEGANESKVPKGDVYTYHIDTIEGLVAFILELKNYYSKSEVTQEEFETNLNMVYNEILQSVNANVSIYDWMLDRNTRKEYFNSLFKNNTILDFRLRKKIEEFDNIVNPFPNINLNTIDNNFIVNGDISNTDIFNGVESCYKLTDKESDISFRTIKNERGFVIILFIPTELNEVRVYHYFNQGEEVIAFEKYDYKHLNRLEYNITDGTFGKQYGKKHNVTVEDKNFVIKKINKYIDIAKEIVNKNISCKSEEKPPVLKKNK